MAETFFFYDLETTGISPRTSRIMQFAGQRTNMQLKPIGEPVNRIIKLSDDIVPEPDAILITGITPQQTLQDGETEVDFLKYFTEEIATEGTIFVGYNTIRFDDEFMRFLHYRNYYDPYEWQWAEGRSKWDLLDVVRMTRALRPAGIEWPFAPDGSPSNRLEYLTKVNKLDHEKAHDALSDVYATIAVATLIRNKQQKLFEYLLSIRDKKSIAKIAESTDPFVYSSGRYSSEFEKATVVASIGAHPIKQGNTLVYDLRHDPTQWIALTVPELVERLRFTRDENAPARLPVKPMQYNHCPAIAPLGVLDAESQQRLAISISDIQKNLTTLRSSADFTAKVAKAFAILDEERQTEFVSARTSVNVDEALYDGFFDTADKNVQRMVRAAAPSELLDASDKFHDGRLRELMPRYKARNFKDSLSTEERREWEVYRTELMLAGGESSRLAKYFKRLGQLAEQSDLTQNQQYILEELQLYGQSIMPEMPELAEE